MIKESSCVNTHIFLLIMNLAYLLDTAATVLGLSVAINLTKATWTTCVAVFLVLYTIGYWGFRAINEKCAKKDEVDDRLARLFGASDDWIRQLQASLNARCKRLETAQVVLLKRISELEAIVRELKEA